MFPSAISISTVPQRPSTLGHQLPLLDRLDQVHNAAAAHIDAQLHATQQTLQITNFHCLAPSLAPPHSKKLQERQQATAGLSKHAGTCHHAPSLHTDGQRMSLSCAGLSCLKYTRHHHKNVLACTAVVCSCSRQLLTHRSSRATQWTTNIHKTHQHTCAQPPGCQGAAKVGHTDVTQRVARWPAALRLALAPIPCVARAKIQVSS